MLIKTKLKVIKNNKKISDEKVKKKVDKWISYQFGIDKYKSKQDKLLWDYSAHINLAEKIHFKILKKEIL